MQVALRTSTRTATWLPAPADASKTSTPSACCLRFPMIPPRNANPAALSYPKSRHPKSGHLQAVKLGSSSTGSLS